MSENQILELIKNTVTNLEPDSTVYLFGSRARKTHHIKSDFDILVVTSDSCDDKRKLYLMRTIRKRLADLYVDVDVLVNSKSQVNSKINIPGSIYQTVFKEGLHL